MDCAKATKGVLRAVLGVGMVFLTSAAGWGQSGTLQNPPHPPAETAAPTLREHVRAATPVHGQTPVVQPHGSIHPAKPPPVRQPHALTGHPAAKAPEPQKPAEPGSAPAQPTAPAKPEEPDKGSATGMALPRFATLRSDDVNMRAGPGTRYPIDWVYKRRDLPVEIEREFEVWRLVRDADGTRGWVHQATLTGRRSFAVQGADATLRSEPKDDAAPVAILKTGVIGRIRSCEAGAAWCRVQVGDYSGYLMRAQFWGTLPGEAVAP